MKEISLAIFFCSVATSPAAPGTNGQESPETTHPIPAAAVATIDPTRTCAYWKEKLITGVCAGYAFVNESVAHLTQCPTSSSSSSVPRNATWCDRATCCPHKSCTGYLCRIPHIVGVVISLEAIRPDAHTIGCHPNGCDFDTCCMPTCVGFTLCSAEKNEVLIPHPHRVVCSSGSSSGSKVSSKSSPCTVESCCESTCGALYDKCPNNFKPTPLLRLARCPSPYGCNPRGGGARVSSPSHEGTSKKKDGGREKKKEEEKDTYKVIDHCCAPTCGHTGGGGEPYRCKAEGTTLFPHADYIRCKAGVSTNNDAKTNSTNRSKHECNDATCCYGKTPGEQDSDDGERNNLHLSGRNYRLTFLPPDGKAHVSMETSVDLFSTVLKKLMCEHVDVKDKQITLNTTWVQDDNASDESLTISSMPHLEVTYTIASLTALKRQRIISLVGNEPFWVFLNAQAGNKVWESGPYWEGAWRFYHLNVKDPERPHKKGLKGAPPNMDNNKGSRKIYLFIGVAILGLLCVVLTVTCCAWLRTYRRLNRKRLRVLRRAVNSRSPMVEREEQIRPKKTPKTREDMEQEKTKPNPRSALARKSTGPDLEAQVKRTSENSTQSINTSVAKSPHSTSKSVTVQDVRNRKGSADAAAAYWVSAGDTV